MRSSLVAGAPTLPTRQATHTHDPTTLAELLLKAVRVAIATIMAEQ